MSNGAGIYFSEIFGVEPDLVSDYGALDICLESDLPLFVDPFLLFSSKKDEYRRLHDSIIKYLKYLRDIAPVNSSDATLKDLYCFHEVKQNWLGFTALGNGGSGLGMDFAKALHGSLYAVLKNFGEEKITKSAHLEKLAIIKQGVGRDCISDFTTNLIKEFLLDYTQVFANQHLEPSRCGSFNVDRVRFDYELQTWLPKIYYLPKYKNDFVLLTPIDILTKDDTWINRTDFVGRVLSLSKAVDDDILRERLNRYLDGKMRELDGKPTKQDRAAIASEIMMKFPEVVDYYLKDRELSYNEAISVSSEKVGWVSDTMIRRVRNFAESIICNGYKIPNNIDSLSEARQMVGVFKDYIENNDGYKLINKGNYFSSEKEVQLFFGLVLKFCTSDANREVNNGRGPVDFKLSNGSKDKTLIEFKLASNPALKRNLKNQVEVYKKANNTKKSIKVIVYYTRGELGKVNAALEELDLAGSSDVVLIDARCDNKPSASKT